jgi:predicted AlkP superfamily phosphohydrolase/phosphomutase
LQLVAKDYADCEVVDQDGVKILRKGAVSEPLTIHLVGARWANFPWGMENEMFRALEKMGFDVFDTDYRLQRENFEELFLRPAHLLLVFKGSGISPDLIRRYPGRTVLWYQDDIFATGHAPRDIAHNAHAFDTVYSFDRSALDEYRKFGVHDARWLPLAMSPAVHRKLFLPKEQDVVFVGNVYPNRAALLERLQKRFNVLVTKAYMDEMVRLFNQAKIVLNLGIGSTGIQSRVFEALGCGSFLLTNEIPDDTRLFEDRKHLAYFNDDNIEELIEYYLHHDEERESIALAGYRKAHAEHTYEHRVEQLIKEQIAEARPEQREEIQVVTPQTTVRASKGPRILVVGFDGMEPNILLDNLEEFPTFKALMKEGSWGTLEVTPVPGTLEGWASIYTGCAPSNHGMDETAWKARGGRIEDFPKFADLRAKTVWEMFGGSGRTSGCFNIPFVHYMPQRHNDHVRYIVPGYFVPPHIRPYPRQVWPLLQGCPSEQGSIISHKPHVAPEEWSNATGQHQRRLKAQYVQEAMSRDLRRHEYCKRLIRELEPDFAFNVFHETDRIGHFVLDCLDLMVEGYKIADQILARMMELEYDYLVVISDHGIWYQDSELCERTVKIAGRQTFASGGYRLANSTHSAHAIFIISGEGIAADRRIEGSLYDVTPTLCHLAGVPVPEQVDGRVLHEVFAGQVLDEKEQEHLKEQLAGLGYI